MVSSARTEYKLHAAYISSDTKLYNLQYWGSLSLFLAHFLPRTPHAGRLISLEQLDIRSTSTGFSATNNITSSELTYQTITPI